MRRGRSRRALHVSVPALVALAGAIGAPPAAAQAAELATLAGRVIWPDHDVTAARVQVARDAKFQDVVVTFGSVTEQGTWGVPVDAGTYYLQVIVDLDADSKASPGDGFGWYGVTDFTDERQRPRAVTAKAGAVVQRLDVHITCILAPGGLLEPVKRPTRAAGPPLPANGPPVRARDVHLAGRVVWDDHTFESVHLVVMTPGREPVQYLRPAADTGGFALTLPPGQYIVLAFADLNASGEVDAGDRAWSYGSAPLEGTSDPARLSVTSQEEAEPLVLSYAGVVRNDGAVLSGDGQTILFQLDLSRLPALVTGRVLWGEPIGQGSVQFSKDVTFARVGAQVSLDSEDGVFCIALRPGEYFSTAMLDLNEDDQLGPGDVIGFYGLDDFAGGAPPAAIHAPAGRIVDGIEIRVTARLDDDSKPQPLPR